MGQLAQLAGPVIDPARVCGDLFDRLAAEWRAGTETTSNLREILMHPAHLKLIGLGQDALPFIFDDLRRGGGPWFLALASITRENPVDPAHPADAKSMRADWLEWGQRHGYVPAEPGI
jgi:hypothetical protein